MSCIIDTNPLIYLIGGSAPPDVLERIEHATCMGGRFSVLTRIEILGWHRHTSESRRATVALLDQLVEIPLTRAIVERTIELRSMLLIKLPDAIIAATALTEGLPLMTRNSSDFKRIPGLTVIDPFAT